MPLLIAYVAFAYLFILGQILGELICQIKLARFHLVYFVLAPLFLPVFIGFWCANMMNPDAPKLPKE